MMARARRSIIAAAAATILTIMAGVCLCTDPAPLQDYCVADLMARPWINGFPCIDPAKATAADFQTSVLANPTNTSAVSLRFNAAFAGPETGFPGINTLGFTFSRADFEGNAVAPPHVHPRASEIVYVMEGSLLWGFVDTRNKVFGSVANQGDMFVVPPGLIHYVANNGSGPAWAVVAYTSQNPGVSFIPSALFGSSPSVPDNILTTSFRISQQDVAAIRKALGGH